MNNRRPWFLICPALLACFALSLDGQADSGNPTTLRNWKFTYALKGGDTVGGITIQQFVGLPVCDPALTQCLTQFVAQDGVGTLYTARMFFNGNRPVLVSQMPQHFFRAQMSDNLITAITGSADQNGITHLYYLTADNQLVGPILSDGDYLGGQIGTAKYAGATNITPDGKILTGIANITTWYYSVYVYNKGEWQPYAHTNGGESPSNPIPDAFSLGVSNQKGCGTIHVSDPYGNDWWSNLHIGCINFRNGQITMPPFPFTANGQTYNLGLPVTFWPSLKGTFVFSNYLQLTYNDNNMLFLAADSAGNVSALMADNSGNYQVAIPTALYAPDPYVIVNSQSLLDINRQGEFGINVSQTNYGDPITQANLLYGQTSNPGTVEPVAMFGDALFGVSGWAMNSYFAIGDNGRMAFNRTVYQKDGSFNSYFVFAQRLNPAVSLESQEVLAGETITVKGANQLCYSDGQYTTMVWLNGQGLNNFNCADSQTITFTAPATEGKYVVRVGLLQAGDWSNPLLTNGNGTSFTVMPPSWRRRHVVNP